MPAVSVSSLKFLERGLRFRWTRLWQRIGVQTPPSCDDLLERWQEPHRAYHTLEHLAHCFSVYDRSPYRYPLVELSLWFHDAIYDPRSATNEADSAELADHVMQSVGLQESQRDTVKRCILATRHRDPPQNALEGLTLDVDLVILGAGRRCYTRYERGIRTEYAWVPGDDYRRERGRILHRFLTHRDLYQLPWFRRRYSVKAKANLRWSLRYLGADHG